MRLGVLLVFLIVVLTLFSVNASAQACFEDNEREVEFSHPTDTSLYFFPLNKDFSSGVTAHGKHVFEKGTTKLVFFTSSFTTATTSDTKAFARTVEPKYNNSNNYAKTTDFTETTVAGFTAYYIEYSSNSTDDKGIMTVIIGPEYDAKTKVYIIDLTAKSARFEEEKKSYLGMLDSFSLSSLKKCSAVVVGNDSDNDGVDDADDNCPSSPNASQSNSDNDSFGDACDNCPLDDNEDQADSNGNGAGDVCEGSITPCTDAGGICQAQCSGASISAGDAQCSETKVCCEPEMADNTPSVGSNTIKEPAQEPFTIFGFDGWIVIAGIILLLLVAGAGIVGLVILGVVIYFFFIKKK